MCKEGIDVCSSNVIHQDIVNNVIEKMPEETDLNTLAEFFKVFGDNTRMKIIWALSISEMCVCDISTLINMSQSAISHQLKILRQSKLVRYRREGKVVYYSLDDLHIKDILNTAMVHIREK